MFRLNSPGRLGAGIVLALSTLTAPITLAQEEQFRLPTAVPDDVFLCISARPNPERDFLDNHWAEVWEAFEDSGVIDDLLDILPILMGEEEQAELERLMDRAVTVVEAVDWAALGGSEFLFAERMPTEFDLKQGFMPEMVWLFQGNSEGIEANFDKLVAILDTITAEVNGYAGEEMLSVSRGERHGAHVASLIAPTEIPIPFRLQLARRGDVIAIGMGKTILDETLALMAGEGAVGSMAADPEYTAAVASVPQAEDLISYFDMQAMLGSLREMADQIVSMQVPAAGGGGSNVTNAYRTPEANQLNQQSVEAYRQGDYGLALELIRKAHDVDPGDSVVLYNLACFNALNGNPEKAIDWLEKAVAGGFNNPDLIGSDSDLDSIRENPRFGAALQQARSAVPDGSEDWKAMADQVVTMIFDVPSVLDHVVAIEFTEGHATHTLTRASMSADAKSKPIYEVFGHRPALAQFDRFLPVETVTFAVDSGIDPSAFYSFIEDSVRSVGPQGEAILEQWAGMQEEMDFNLAKDVFGWIEGEMISASLGRGMSANWIMMAKVTNEELAHEKILAGLDALSVMIEDFAEAAGNPMLNMMIPEITPMDDERLPGFHTVAMGGQPVMIWGVTE